MMQSELDNIHEAIATFVEGLRTLDYDMISQIFHSDARSFGLREQKATFVERYHWKEMGDRDRKEGWTPDGNESYFEIQSVNISGHLATVVVQLGFTDNPVDYIDMYNMLKTSDGWIIVNKIGRATEKKI